MWAHWGKDNGYDYMIVVCDTGKMEDYPVFCMENEFDETYRYTTFCGEVREVYSFFLDVDEQIESGIVMNTPTGRRRE